MKEQEASSIAPRPQESKVAVTRVLIGPYFQVAKMSTSEFLGVSYCEVREFRAERKRFGTKTSGKCSQVAPKRSWAKPAGSWTLQQWLGLQLRPQDLRWAQEMLNTTNK